VNFSSQIWLKRDHSEKGKDIERDMNKRVSHKLLFILFHLLNKRHLH
jgi:hypothetical protein